MSGGLDSGVALALLAEAGRPVLGVTMRLWQVPGEEQSWEDSAASAREVCCRYGARYITVDFRERFSAEVVTPFASEYASARTPNPCVRCNQRIKFGALLDAIGEYGCGMLATGHYARIAPSGDGYRLLRGVDSGKDQSYFLYMLTQRQLARILFPLGGLRKDQVRALARERGLAVANRAESRDVCFLRGQRRDVLLSSLVQDALQPGPIVDSAGRRLGTHRGLALYTVGQRSGLGIAADRPLYVLRLDVASNTVVVGYSEEGESRALMAEEMSWVSGFAVQPGSRVQAQIRYRSRAIPSIVESIEDGRARVRFDRPVRGIAPGQAIVLYDREEVLGGGCIVSASPDGHSEEQ